MKIFILTSLIISLIFLFLKHPVSMGFTLIIQTLLISLITGNMNFNFWYSYIIFIIMVGGMLILFIYMTSIASNEKFKFNPYLLTFLMIFISMIFLPSMKFINSMSLKLNFKIIPFMSFEKFIFSPLMFNFFFLMIYLLISLIAIVKITNFNSGPLRQKN